MCSAVRHRVVRKGRVHDAARADRALQRRHVTAVNVTRRRQSGQAPDSSRLAGDQYAKSGAGIGARQ